MTPYVKRQDITLTEELIPINHRLETTSIWTAALSGRLSTGEHVDMTRTGNTFAEALANLENAIAALGWEVKG